MSIWNSGSVLVSGGFSSVPFSAPIQEVLVFLFFEGSTEFVCTASRSQHMQRLLLPKELLQRRPKSRNSFSFVLPQLISPLPQLSASNLELLSLSVIDCLQGKKKSRSRMVLLREKTWLCLLYLQWGKSISVLSKTLVLSSFKFIYCKS
ncbi:hypothetical protein ES332_D10G318700v1 [Gossypium tomentosum]|uniref:Uncharacterized protein n=1 Tax=Gossypium tomentosum TaxID=34277 RepID=A0A5D2JD89_GOSTO|nr:hypothetical protein ES332_D10G318700v1 [Gossypium tomentosum]